MKNQALVSSYDKSKKLKCRLLQVLFAALRVKVNGYSYKGSNSAIVNSASLHRSQHFKGRLRNSVKKILANINTIMC